MVASRSPATQFQTVRPHALGGLLHIPATVVGLLIACAGIAPEAWGQADPRASRSQIGIEPLFLRLDNGPLGAPPADNFGLGVRATLVPGSWPRNLGIDLHASYLLAGPNSTPNILHLGTDLVAALFPIRGARRLINPVATVGLGVATLLPGGLVTLEAYCSYDGECTGRDRFRSGPRPWVALGFGVEAQLAGWLPHRIYVQLLMPTQGVHADNGDPPYVRVGLLWGLTH